MICLRKFKFIVVFLKCVLLYHLISSIKYVLITLHYIIPITSDVTIILYTMHSFNINGIIGYEKCIQTIIQLDILI